MDDILDRTTMKRYINPIVRVIHTVVPTVSVISAVSG